MLSNCLVFHTFGDISSSPAVFLFLYCRIKKQNFVFNFSEHFFIIQDWEYNNKGEDNSPKTLNDKNHKASFQKFRLQYFIILYTHINIMFIILYRFKKFQWEKKNHLLRNKRAPSKYSTHTLVNNAKIFLRYLLLPESCSIVETSSNDPVYLSCPVDWGCKIHWLYLCRG